MSTQKNVHTGAHKTVFMSENELHTETINGVESLPYRTDPSFSNSYC